MRRALHHADEVDAGDHREAPHHRRLAAHRETVLVIDGGPLDAHRHVAVHQFAFVEVDELRGLTGFGLVDTDCPERAHAKAPDPYGDIAGLVDRPVP
jgi:hypothetical protein